MNHLTYSRRSNDVRARRAILTAMSQEEYMRAFVGGDPTLWKLLPGYFTPGTPLYNEEGGEILKVRASRTPPSVCWLKAATRVSRSFAWRRRICRTTRRGERAANLGRRSCFVTFSPPSHAVTDLPGNNFISRAKDFPPIDA
jgi:hypothetical protein